MNTFWIEAVNLVVTIGLALIGTMILRPAQLLADRVGRVEQEVAYIKGLLRNRLHDEDDDEATQSGRQKRGQARDNVRESS